MRQSALPSLGFAILAGALAFGCGGSGYGMSSAPSTPTAAAPPADSNTIIVGVVGNNGASSFSPNPASAKVGQKVSWKNNDGIVHHIVEDTSDNMNDGYGYGPGNGSNSGNGFDGGVTAPGGMSGTMTLGNAGTMRYHCTIHPGMVGSIVVQ